jgi:hypothetical protein
MDYGHTRQQSAELEKLVIQNLQHVVMLTVIVIDYYMAFFILHVISTRIVCCFEKKRNSVVFNLCILKMFIIENYFEIIE